MPTVTRGIITTVTDTTNIKRDVSEVIDFLSPTDAPILDLIGQDSLHSPCTQVQHEWMEDELEPRSGTLGAAYTAGDGQIELASGEGAYLIPGDTVLLGNMVMRVTAGPPDSDIATITLLGDSVDANVANGSTWRKIVHAAQEGGVARDEGTKVHIVMPYNYTQIIKDWIVVTGTMEVIDRYGYASERAYQEEKLMKRLAIDLEFDILYGSQSYDEGPPRVSTMGGLLHYVLLPGIANSWDTVHNASGAQFTETMLNDVLQQMWYLGGNPDFIIVNGTNKRRITSWATPRIRTDREMRTAGASIGTYESDFGFLDIILDRHMRPEDVIVGTRGSMGLGPLTGRQFTSRMLPSTLDGTWYEILGEYTMEVHKPTIDWGWFYNTDSTY